MLTLPRYLSLFSFLSILCSCHFYRLRYEGQLTRKEIQYHMIYPAPVDPFEYRHHPVIHFPNSVSAMETTFSTSSVKLPSGVRYFDVVEGSSLLGEAKEGKTVQFQWVLRKSNGYFVSSSKVESPTPEFDEPFIYKVGNTKKVIPGLDEGIRGMKVGGIRRIIVPADLAYIGGTEDDSPGPIPRGFGPKRQIASLSPKDFWIFEVKLVKAKE